MHRAFSLVSLSACLLASAVCSTFDLGSFKPQDIITRDVAVIGGGSAGTYAAISLKDKGKSVIVIEKKGKLGGHFNTYIDPATGTPIDIGVMFFHNISIVRDYFRRFDVPLTNVPRFFQSLKYDFRTGKEVPLSFTPSEKEISAAVVTYAEQLSKYPGLEDGVFLPDPVPEELYRPFGEFVLKYGIQAAVLTMCDYDPGVGDILANPTVEVFRKWTLDFVDSYFNGMLMTARRNASEIFTKAEAELSSSASLLLNSEVAHADRGEDGAGIRLVVRTPQGKKLICAKKLLIAIPPKLDFVAPFDLSDDEKTLFGKYIDVGYYIGIVRNTGFPDDNTLIANAAPDTEYNLPHLPRAYSFFPGELPGLQRITYATAQSRKSFPMPEEEVKADILRSVKRLQEQNPGKFVSQGEPEWVDFQSDSPYYLQAPAEDIKNGFYQKLYALQGLRNTYWTGAAFIATDSSLIWKFTEEIVLPQLLSSL
jgi:hypothetical protein